MLKDVYSKEDLEELDKTLEFVPMTYDQMFKKIFGNNKELLKKFLFIVLDLDIDYDSCKIEVGVNELPKEQYSEYGSRIDINIMLNENIKVILEVNQEKFEDILDRNFLYVAKGHTLNFKKGMKYKDFHNKKTIQLNLNTNHFGTEVNGEDTFYLKSRNTGQTIVDNFKIVIKDLDYYRNLYYTNKVNCENDVLWLAMLTSKSFTELASFLKLILDKKSSNNFLKEVIDMCENEFFVHQWLGEKASREIVEGRMEYNANKRADEKAKVLAEKLAEERIKQFKEKLTEEVAEEKKEIIVNTIKSMLENNIDYDTISKVTNKSLDEIKEIENSCK